MNHKFSAAVLLLLVCLIAVFAGCQSSNGTPSELSSIEEDSNWADLNPEESPTPTPTPTPSTDVVMPELSEEETDKDITEDYLGTFVGTWDNDGKTVVWTFGEDGTLQMKKTSDQSEENWEWCVIEVSGGSRLKLTSDTQNVQYSFTVNNGSTITLFDPGTGNAAEVLTRVEEDEEEEKPAESTAPTATPTAAPSPSASATAAPTATPAAQTAAPAASQEPAPTATAAAEPETQGETGDNQESAGNTSEYIIEEIKSSANYEAVESVLDTLALGYGYDSADSNSFWNAVASYLCKIHQDPDDEGYIYVSADEVQTAGTEIYGSLSGIPACPSGSGIVSETEDGSYRILWGQSGGHDTEYISYEGNEIVVSIDGTSYKVVTMPSGAVQSVEKLS